MINDCLDLDKTRLGTDKTELIQYPANDQQHEYDASTNEEFTKYWGK